MNYKRTDFFGRKWLFRELENVFEKGRGPLGVLITGEPGSGKSALMSQLICSPFSSLLIQSNIIGYHVCDYSEKGKRDGARFVRNLVDQIAGNLPEYSDHVINNEQIRNELDKRCDSDPIGCFHSTIVGPLRELKNAPDNLRYIVIDALDECLEEDRKSSAILDVLNSKLVLFPKWLKVVLSSRNWTAVTDKLPLRVKRMSLDPTDERNIEDIRSYIRHFLVQNSFFMDRLLEAMGLKSTEEGINSLINEMSKSGEGNFLFVKTTLQYLSETEGRINLRSFPTSLYDTYNIYFRRQFGKGDFSRFKVLFEVLLAASSPLQLNEIDYILKRRNTTSMLPQLLQQASSFLRFGQDGTVSIYHQSFAEWLMKQTDDAGVLSINKTRGHQYMADYLFDFIEKKNHTPFLEELTELAVHVSSGGMLDRHLTGIKRMNISKIRDPYSGRCILHGLAVRKRTAAILDIFLQMFESADIYDFGGMTPALYAASKGNVENLKAFIKKGIDLNYLAKSVCVPAQDPVQIVISRVMELQDYSIVHVAASNGHVKTVKLLIKSGASFDKPNRDGLTPLHLAALNGHLAVVKLLYLFGAKADLIALHHAAARNHGKLVQFLLQNASVKDECLPCKRGNVLDFSQNTTMQDIHRFFCETALHAAVSRRHLDIVKLLIKFGKPSLECKHRSGKTPLIDAVERNDTEMVELLLNQGANVNAECERETSGEFNVRLCVASSLLKEDFLYALYCEVGVCSCGNRAIHLCGKYGLWKMAEKLITRWKADMLATNCKRLIAVHTAVFHDHDDFINHFNRTLSKRTHLVLTNEAFLHSAVLCGSNSALKLLSSNTKKAAFTQMYDSGMTLLHYATKWSPYPNSDIRTSFCSQTIMNISNDLLMVKLKNESIKRLNTVKFLTESQKDVHRYVNLKDRNGRTALHYAALAGFAGAVKYLVRHGGDWKMKDQDGNTPLILALTASPQNPKFVRRYRMASEKVFKMWNTTVYDETVAHLIWLNRSSIRKCDMESMKILSVLVKKKMPISLYKLLKIGVDVNCTVKESPRPFLHHLYVESEQVSEVFKIFKANITVECDVDFGLSELHLVSFFAGSGDVGNFFKPSRNNLSFPMQRLVSRTPKALQIFNECRDKEGYLAIHRAAEGGNVDAINWFINSKVDFSKKTRSGLTALDISIFLLGDSLYPRLFLFHDGFSMYLRRHITGERQRDLTFEKLLVETSKAIRNHGYSSWCGQKVEGLSPLHLAASRGIGLFEFVYKRVVKIIPGLPRNCANKHNVVPLYLANLYYKDGFCSCNHSHVQLQTVDSDSRMTFFQYPDREAEYNMIYNLFYESPNVDSNFALNIRNAVNCSGFFEVLPKREALADEMKKCYAGCWIFISHIYNYSMKGLPFRIIEECQKYDANDEWSRKITFISKLQYLSEENNFSSRFRKEITEALMCSKQCRCADMMQKLQRKFTSQLRKNRVVNAFTARRMGWKDTSLDGDVRDRWPFYFLYKKALNEYEPYQYLETLNRGIEMNDSYFHDYDGVEDNVEDDDVEDDDDDDDDDDDNDNFM